MFPCDPFKISLNIYTCIIMYHARHSVHSIRQGSPHLIEQSTLHLFATIPVGSLLDYYVIDSGGISPESNDRGRMCMRRQDSSTNMDIGSVPPARVLQGRRSLPSSLQGLKGSIAPLFVRRYRRQLTFSCVLCLDISAEGNRPYLRSQSPRLATSHAGTVKNYISLICT